MISVKLYDFRATLNKQLVESYPDYRINEYFNTEYSSISWLRVSDVSDSAKVLTIAEVIAVERFTSRDDTSNLLVIDYVNSDSRRFTNVPAALSFMRYILVIASKRKKAELAKARIEANEKQCEPVNKRSEEGNWGEWPTKFYLVTGRHNGKTLFYQNLLKNLFGFQIKDVIFNNPATVIFWSDGEKTVVKCQDGEEFDPEKGLAMAISKRIYGNDYNYYEVFKKWIGKYKKKKFREALNNAMKITPDEITRNGHRYVLVKDEIEVTDNGKVDE